MKQILLLKAFLIIPILSYAIDIINIKFDHLNVDNGLSQSTVECIIQDSQGYIWIGTRDGLNKYDGFKFEIFQSDREDTNSLASSWVTSLAEDAEGNIWIGSNGLNVYNPKLDKLTRIVTNPDDEYSYHGGKIYDIVLDNDNSLWLATVNGLVHYIPETKTFKTFNNISTTGDQSGNIVYSVIVTKDNRFFVATQADPLFEFNRKTETFIEHNYKLKFAGANFKKKIQEDLNGLLYIGSEGAAIHIYNPTTQETEFIDVGANSLNSLNVKTKVLPISKDEVLIGTDGGGINIYNPISKAFKYLRNDPVNPYSLSDNAIYSMIEDMHGNIWVGHYGTGISLWKKNKYKFQSFFHNPFDSLTISNGVVLAIFQDSKDRIWIGIDGGGLNQFDISSQTFKHYRRIEGLSSSLTSDVIISIAETDSGELLLGTFAGGLMVFDPELGEVIKSYQMADGLSAAHIWDITRDSEGKFWLSTLGQGYDEFDPTTESFVNHVWGEDPNACSNVIYSITEAPDGKMWFGTENSGICVLNKQDGTMKTYSVNENDINSISSNNIKCILFQDNYAWIATGAGLNRLDLRNDSIKVYTTKDRLSSNALMGILEDNNGQLWISSTNGLMKFNPGTEMIVSYDKSQGLQGSEFKYNSQFILKDGRMLFGGVNGLTLFDPDAIIASPVIPKVVFTNLLVNNSQVEIGAKGSPLKQHINNTSKIKFRHQDRVITLEFASLDYTSPSKNKYRYMLEGFDKDWVNIDNRNFVSYNNLSPGKYIFHLKGSNSDGVWSTNVRSIDIIIRPPWYKTKAFILLAITLIALGVWVFVRERIRKAKLEKTALQKRIDEGQAIIDSKLKEIEEQQEQIKNKNEQEKEIRFQTDGLAKFSTIISQSRNDLKQLSGKIISELITYVGANAGALYVADKDEDNMTNSLRIYGQYCYDGEIETKDKILVGEGYIGTAYLQKQTIVIDDLSKNYIKIGSGLGLISAKYNVIEPIIEEEEAMGAIEIASLEKLPKYKLEFIKQIAKTFASLLAIEQANDKSKKLLEENKQQTEEILSQEEELRQNLEELQTTQEMSQRRELELKKEVEEKNKIIEYLQKKMNS